MKINIDKIFKNETNKDGQSYLDKNGRPYTRVVIQLGNDKYSNIAYEGDPSLGWRAGDEVDIDTSTKGEYKNFKPAGLNPHYVPKKPVQGNLELKEVHRKLDEILLWIDTQKFGPDL